MKTLEQIKNDYSKEQSFENWNDLIEYYLNQQVYEKENNIKVFSNRRLQNHIDAVMKIYAMECLKVASENSKVLVEGILTEERKTLFTLFDKGVKGVVQRKVSVCRESITNENNIIK